jgi:NAD+ dependent glucose-6-phosphate dehydrogenase
MGHGNKDAADRLLLIGGSGSIGQFLARAMQGRFEIVIIDPSGPPPAGSTWVRCTAAEAPPGLVRDGDIVVFAATGERSEWDALLATEIVGLRNIALQAAAVGVARFILLSSSRVAFGAERDIAAGGYMDLTLLKDDLRTDTVRPLTEYGAAKAFSEAFLRMLAEDHGLPSSILRIGTFRRLDDPGHVVDAGIPDMPMPKELLARRLSATWLRHEDLLRIVEEEISAPETFRRRFAVSAPPQETWFPLEVETWTL